MRRYQFSLRNLLFIMVPLGLAAIIFIYRVVATYQALNDLSRSIALGVLVVLAPILLGVPIVWWTLSGRDNRDASNDRRKRNWDDLLKP